MNRYTMTWVQTHSDPDMQITLIVLVCVAYFVLLTQLQELLFTE